MSAAFNIPTVLPANNPSIMTSDRQVETPTPPSKLDLVSWWRQFKKTTTKKQPEAPRQGIFGFPLSSSTRYASVAISCLDDRGQSHVYGVIPIVVAKCGMFLKEKAITTKGIFRVNGSAKRIKDLQDAFDSPPNYGRALEWAGYSVHDAANVLRRYLNQLPEPIVPLDFYEKFRDPLKQHIQKGAVLQDNHNALAQQHDPNQGLDFPHSQSSLPGPSENDYAMVIRSYQQLIRELPLSNRHLLLYILDLLAVFAAKCDHNFMTAANLAAIFQPGLLSHPIHAMDPDEYKLSQDVLIFLIENQDHFLLDMHGIVADEKAVKEAAQAQQALAVPQAEATTKKTPALSPAVSPAQSRNNSKSGVRRSVSNASAGADSLRKYEAALRRNQSVASSHPRSRVPSASSGPDAATSANQVGQKKFGLLHRSNTAPTKRRARPGPFSPNLPNQAPSQSPAVPDNLPQLSVNLQTGVPAATMGTGTGVSGSETGRLSPVPPRLPHQIPTIPERSPLNNSLHLAEPRMASPTRHVSSPLPVSSISPTRPPMPMQNPQPLRVQSPPRAPSSPPQRPVTPPREPSKFSSLLLALSPPSSSDDRQGRSTDKRSPNKLRKKPPPGMTNESPFEPPAPIGLQSPSTDVSAHSSTHSLAEVVNSNPTPEEYSRQLQNIQNAQVSVPNVSDSSASHSEESRTQQQQQQQHPRLAGSAIPAGSAPSHTPGLGIRPDGDQSFTSIVDSRSSKSEGGNGRSSSRPSSNIFSRSDGSSSFGSVFGRRNKK